MTGRCETCQWWGGLDDAPSWHKREWHTCESRMVYRGYTVSDDDSILVHVENDVGWGIATAPNFGCVLWEERKP